MSQTGQPTQRRIEDENAFWRKLVLPQEDRMRLGIPWHGGYRWFRSPNVVCLEHYRRRRPAVADNCRQ
jgi:hypothetical protein